MEVRYMGVIWVERMEEEIRKEAERIGRFYDEAGSSEKVFANFDPNTGKRIRPDARYCKTCCRQLNWYQNPKIENPKMWQAVCCERVHFEEVK
jgi:hypothetical protein